LFGFFCTHSYASREVVNWVTTLADSVRVAADLGAVRFGFVAFQRAIFIFKVLAYGEWWLWTP
jgi:hypothetical protein